MKAYLIVSFSLAVSLLPFSCSPGKRTASEFPWPPEAIPGISPLGETRQTKLFKAGIDVFKSHYSGLVLIKAMPGDHHFRILFLSELGLNLLDMEFDQGEFKVVTVQEFFNRPFIIRAIQNDFQTLLLDLSGQSPRWISSGRNVDGITYEIYYHKGRQRYWFHYRKGSGTYKIRRKQGCFGGTDIYIERKEGQRILIDHRGIQLKIELAELKQIREYPYE